MLKTYIHEENYLNEQYLNKNYKKLIAFFFVKYNVV